MLFRKAYVTNDLDRALGLFRRTYGMANWTMVEAGTPRIALAWIDKAGAFVVRCHHDGYLVRDDAEWARLRAQIAADGRPILIGVDGVGLGYIFPNEQGEAFHEGVAAN